jgi:hypothetical protein
MESVTFSRSLMNMPPPKCPPPVTDAICLPSMLTQALS